MKTLLTICLLVNITISGFSKTDSLSIKINDSINLLLVKEVFIKDSNKIIYWDKSQTAITSINGEPIFGTDATLPNSQLSFAELEISGRKILLETSGMFDPWEEEYSNIECKVEKFLGNPLKLKCWFSAGAGLYLVEWTIIDDKSFRTIITYDHNILDAIDLKK